MSELNSDDLFGCHYFHSVDNYQNVDNSTLELKYYKYLEQNKNYLKFYCVLESKYYQFVESGYDYLKLTDTVDKEYYKY